MSGEELARFESHAARVSNVPPRWRRPGDKRRLQDLFADSSPAAGFEDRLIARLRRGPSPRPKLTLKLPPLPKLHPSVRHAAAAVAASVVVGTIGTSDEIIDSDSADRNLRQTGQAGMMYSNESKGIYAEGLSPRQSDSCLLLAVA